MASAPAPVPVARSATRSATSASAAGVSTTERPELRRGDDGVHPVASGTRAGGQRGEVPEEGLGLERTPGVGRPAASAAAREAGEHAARDLGQRGVDSGGDEGHDDEAWEAGAEREQRRGVGPREGPVPEVRDEDGAAQRGRGAGGAELQAQRDLQAGCIRIWRREAG